MLVIYFSSFFFLFSSLFFYFLIFQVLLFNCFFFSIILHSRSSLCCFILLFIFPIFVPVQVFPSFLLHPSFPFISPSIFSVSFYKIIYFHLSFPLLFMSFIFFPFSFTFTLNSPFFIYFGNFLKYRLISSSFNPTYWFNLRCNAFILVAAHPVLQECEGIWGCTQSWSGADLIFGHQVCPSGCFLFLWKHSCFQQ